MPKLGLQPVIHETATIQNCLLGRYTEVGARTALSETSMDDYSYIVNDCEVIYTSIGKFCSIAAMVRINPGNHPMWRASQSHFTYRSSAYFAGADDDEDFFDWRRSHPVVIGHDVWIGHGAIVMPGRTIGNGAVVAAGSIVTKDVPSYTIVAGQPARTLRPRFDPRTAARLETLAWWDWPHDRLRDTLRDFRTLSAEEFLNRHGGN